MNQDLDAYHRLVGVLKGKGCDESEAHHTAERIMEDLMTRCVVGVHQEEQIRRRYSR